MPTTPQRSSSAREAGIEPQPVPTLGLADIVLLLIITGMMLFTSWFRSRNRIFWGDEIMGWLVLRQDTWAHLLRVWYGGIDSSGIFFYVLARIWLRVFGSTEVALHLFSAFGMALGFAFTWLCARRFYRIEVVAAVAPGLFLMNYTALWQLANGRTYGVVMTAVALTCYVFVRTSPDHKRVDDQGSLALTAIACSMLVGSHILGVLYWSVFFASFLARDAWFRIFRPYLYLSALVGLSVLAVSWKNIVATTALGKPSFWTLRPGFRQLPSGFYDFSHLTGIIILLSISVFIILFVVQRARGNPEPLFVPERATLYFVLASFALMVLTIFAASKASTPIFVDRYMLPVLIADIFLVCELISRITAMLRLSPRVQVIGTLFAFGFTLPIYWADLHLEAPYPQRDYTTAFLQKLPADVPVILTAQGTFVDMVFYRNDARRFETPIDWDVQLDPNYGPGGVSGTHELENWKTYGFYSDQIKSTPEILAGKNRFVVVSDIDHPLWAQRYLLNNPEYRVQELSPFSTLRIWQVEKVPSR